MATENKYKYSKAYYKILDLITSNPNEKVFVIRGGQGASKTVSVIELTIQALLSSEKEATVLSSELSKMKRTVIRDYKKICRDWGIFKTEDDFNRSESKHEYPNGSYIDFLGADVNDVGKGFRRDILYINEADKMDIETAIQFISRAKLTIIDYNPDKHFWGDDFINDNNFITLTFLDNEFLSDEEVSSILDYKLKGFYNSNLPFEELFAESNIKSKYWANKWKVYGLGMVGSLEGAVFENWDHCDNVPLDAEFIANGMDFGFTNDPTTDLKVFRYNGDLYLDEYLYKTGLTTNALMSALLSAGVTRNELIVADSADPKTITELQEAGFNIESAEKGPDSIRASIQHLQDYKMYVTRRSVNLTNELGKYIWKVDKSGHKENEPVDHSNHLIDALRYVALNRLMKNNSWDVY